MCVARARRSPRRASGLCRWSLAALGLVGLLACASAPDRIPLELLDRRTVAERDGERMEALLFADPRGDSVTAYLRRPVRAAGREELGGVVLVAGREAGQQAARVVPGPLDVAVLAVEYPEALPLDLGVPTMLPRLSEIRASALRVPPILREAGHFLASQPVVDSTRIALVGVSFGVPFAAAAGDDPIFRGVALHHGGGNLELLLEANLPVDNDFLRSLAARALGWYLDPLDPAHHVGQIAPRPLLLINGTRDTTVPLPSALALARAADGPVRQIWLPHEHLVPGDTALMRELADSTLSHFDFLEPGR